VTIGLQSKSQRRFASTDLQNKYHLISRLRVAWIVLLAINFFFAYSVNLEAKKGFAMSAQEKVRVRAPEITGGRG